MKNNKKVYVIGLDGGSFEIMDRLIKQNKLPNFAKLAKIGVISKFLSTVVPKTPQAWSSMLRGKNPGKHGIYTFVRLAKENYNLEYINASYRDAKTIWEYLSEAGFIVGGFKCTDYISTF
jgi:predicted AlkP superfamily phosphohydrolase/phosphomutase